ncbi:MAG: hypothetical protein ACOCYO_07580, partial [Bacteroidota bacterium]
FIQKYTEQELQEIERVQNEVKASCPDYAAQIEEILSNHEHEIEVPEDAIPENILELLLEEFAEPEPESAEDNGEEGDTPSENDEDLPTDESSLEDLLFEADEKINALKQQLIRAKQNLDDLDDELEALNMQKEAEIKINLELYNSQISSLEKEKKSISLTGLAGEEKDRMKQRKDEITDEIKELRAKRTLEQRELKEHFRNKERELKDERIKPRQKELKAEIKQLENDIPQAEYDKNLLTTKGKLQLILNDDDLLQRLSDRFIAAEVAKRLDYSIFMAVSEYGGKNNSGEYEYLLDEDGNIMEDENGNPVFNQDLVNYNISKAALESLTITPAPQVQEDEVPLAADPEVEYITQGKPLAIAEAFVKYAKEQGFNFWR